MFVLNIITIPVFNYRALLIMRFASKLFKNQTIKRDAIIRQSHSKIAHTLYITQLIDREETGS